MERVLFQTSELEIPAELVHDVEVFRKAISARTWNESFTESERQHLMTFLPSFSNLLTNESAQVEKKRCLQRLFRGDNFKFGNPLLQFHKTLVRGDFNPEIARFKLLLSREREIAYLNFKKVYKMDLLKELLVCRQRILTQLPTLPPGGKLTCPVERPLVSKSQNLVEARAAWKYRKLMAVIRSQCGGDEFSDLSSLSSDDEREDITANAHSDSEEEPDSTRNTNRRRFYVSTEPHNVLSTFQEDPGYHKKKYYKQDGGGDVGAFLFAEAHPRLREQDYKEMLLQHRRKRDAHLMQPELDTRNITLQDIILRVYPEKRAQLKIVDESSSNQRKIKGIKDEKLKKEQVKPEVKAETNTNVRKNQFFKVLRDCFQRRSDVLVSGPSSSSQSTWMSLHELQRQIRIWSDGQSEGKGDTKRWLKLLPSALRFLCNSDDDCFIPYVESKQGHMWRWIGQGRDSDDKLAQLCTQWLVSIGLAAPSTLKTGPSTVRGRGHELREQYRTQERERYKQPHLAFTYKLDGHEFTVAPVKGVFSAAHIGGSMKARTHDLLTSDRPHYVNIVSVVRDAACRLIDGEGSRAEIVDKLRDSQYVVPNAPEQILHNAVSGALDRLHYEKDPCVRYDSVRKVWIYLHFGRSEDEHNRIHRSFAQQAKQEHMARKAMLNLVGSRLSRRGDVPGQGTPPPGFKRFGGPSLLNILDSDAPSMPQMRIRRRRKHSSDSSDSSDDDIQVLEPKGGASGKQPFSSPDVTLLDPPDDLRGGDGSSLIIDHLDAPPQTDLSRDDPNSGLVAAAANQLPTSPGDDGSLLPDENVIPDHTTPDAPLASDSSRFDNLAAAAAEATTATVLQVQHPHEDRINDEPDWKNMETTSAPDLPSQGGEVRVSDREQHETALRLKSEIGASEIPEHRDAPHDFVPVSISEAPFRPSVHQLKVETGQSSSDYVSRHQPLCVTSPVSPRASSPKPKIKLATSPRVSSLPATSSGAAVMAAAHSHGGGVERNDTATANDLQMRRDGETSRGEERFESSTLDLDDAAMPEDENEEYAHHQHSYAAAADSDSEDSLDAVQNPNLVYNRVPSYSVVDEVTEEDIDEDSNMAYHQHPGGMGEEEEEDEASTSPVLVESMESADLSAQHMLGGFDDSNDMPPQQIIYEVDAVQSYPVRTSTASFAHHGSGRTPGERYIAARHDHDGGFDMYGRTERGGSGGGVTELIDSDESDEEAVDVDVEGGGGGEFVSSSGRRGPPAFRDAASAEDLLATNALIRRSRRDHDDTEF